MYRVWLLLPVFVVLAVRLQPICAYYNHTSDVPYCGEDSRGNRFELVVASLAGKPTCIRYEEYQIWQQNELKTLRRIAARKDPTYHLRAWVELSDSFWNHVVAATICLSGVGLLWQLILAAPPLDYSVVFVIPVLFAFPAIITRLAIYFLVEECGSKV